MISARPAPVPIFEKSSWGADGLPITRWDHPKAQLPPQCPQGKSSSVIALEICYMAQIMPKANVKCMDLGFLTTKKYRKGVVFPYI